VGFVRDSAWVSGFACPRVQDIAQRRATVWPPPCRSRNVW